MVKDFTGFFEFCKTHEHRALRLLEADGWTLRNIAPGSLSVECPLPDSVLNLGGFLFGGFTPTYVDYIAIWTCMTKMPKQLVWLSTVSMRVDYLEPITRPGFLAHSKVINIRKKDYLVETRFENDDGKLLAFAVTNLRQSPDKSLEKI